MRIKTLPLLAALCLVIATASHAQTFTITGSGGTLTAATTVGAYISVSGVTTNVGTVDMQCQISSFGASTYQWNWTCAGTLFINGALASVAGSMTLTCAGGGRAHVTTCYHTFTGTVAPDDPLGASGPIYIRSKGKVNNAPSTVTIFSATY